MSEADPSAHPPDADAPLQFDRVEPAAPSLSDIRSDSRGNARGAPAAAHCAACGRPIDGVYWEIAARPTCGACRESIQRSLPGPISAGLFGRAVLWGCSAALVAAILWRGADALIGGRLDIGALGVGILVGTAVARASGGRGGLPLQALAIGLTAACIAQRQVSSGQALNPLYGFLVFIAFAQGWRLNRAPSLAVTGPYRISSKGPAPASDALPHGDPPAPPPTDGEIVV